MVTPLGKSALAVIRSGQPSAAPGREPTSATTRIGNAAVGAPASGTTIPEVNSGCPPAALTANSSMQQIALSCTLILRVSITMILPSSPDDLAETVPPYPALGPIPRPVD